MPLYTQPATYSGEQNGGNDPDIVRLIYLLQCIANNDDIQRNRHHVGQTVVEPT